MIILGSGPVESTCTPAERAYLEACFAFTGDKDERSKLRQVTQLAVIEERMKASKLFDRWVAAMRVFQVARKAHDAIVDEVGALGLPPPVFDQLWERVEAEASKPEAP